MNTRLSVIALAVCAVSDLAAVPLLVGSDDVPTALGVAVGVLGLLTLAAAYGIARGAGWARSMALGTRAIDVAAAVPAVFAGAGSAETSAAVVTVVLSLVTIGLLLRHDSRAVRTA